MNKRRLQKFSGNVFFFARCAIFSNNFEECKKVLTFAKETHPSKKNLRPMAHADTSTQTQRKIDRLDLFASFKNLNDNQLTRELQLAVGTISKSRRPGKDISRRTAEAVLQRFPELNRSWFLTGQGDMFVAERKPDFRCFPIVDTAVAECGVPGGLAEAICADNLPSIALPGVPSNTEFFIRANGYSMVNTAHPELSIPPGALVGLVRNKDNTIRWGEVYAIATVDGIMIKRLIPDKDDAEVVRCVSYNSAEYPEFEVRKDEITDLARLTCVVPIYIR